MSPKAPAAAAIPAVVASAPAPATIPTTQKVWLTIYWFGVLLNLLLLVEGISSIGEVPIAQLVILAIAAVSAVIGALFATRIMASRVTTTQFVKSTTTARVISVAWIFIQLSIYASAIISVMANIDTSLIDFSGGFLGTVGSVSLLAIIGPGYGEYREGMSHASKRDAA